MAIDSSVVLLIAFAVLAVSFLGLVNILVTRGYALKGSASYKKLTANIEIHPDRK